MRVVGGAALWRRVSVVPVFPIGWVPADLQGSRYRYLGMAGWAALLAGTVAFAGRSAVRVTLGLSLAGLVAISALSARRSLQPFQDAARLRDQVLDALRADPAAAACGTVALLALPDNERGAYVFRVGAAEAVRDGLGLRVSTSAEPGCTFRWEAASRRFTR
jgi:hypothetical protein